MVIYSQAFPRINIKKNKVLKVIQPRISKLSFAMLTALSLAACNESTSVSQGSDFGGSTPPPTTEFNEAAMVAALTDNVITPTYQQFTQSAESQYDAVQSYCQAEKDFNQSTTTAAERDQAKLQARDSWKSAMDNWQQVEVMQLGPLLEQDGTLRNKIYSWPIANSCAVDLDVTFFAEGTVNGEPYDITKRTSSRKGLLALEYLLFNDNLDHSCTGSTVPEGWNGTLDSERREMRCEFAQEVAFDIVTNANDLNSRWSGDNGFAAQLKNAGTENSDITSEHAAVNLISDAMFYVDTGTKDGKLAIPVGILANSCGTSACPEDVESKFADYSLPNISQNLIAFEKLLTGDTGLGFTDFLIDEGDQETADAMTTAITTAKANVGAADSTLKELLSSNPEAVEAMHGDVKAITDKLKVDFITTLALELPKTSAGDND